MSSSVALHRVSTAVLTHRDQHAVWSLGRWSISATLVVLACATPLPATTVLDEPADSEIVLTAPVDEWAIGGGFVYWASCCDNVVECPDGGFLKRRALLGDLVETLELTTFGNNTDNFRLMAADDVGVVYYDATQGAIEIRLTASADIATSLHTCDMPDTRLRIHGDYVYWGASDGIWRSRLKPPLETERVEYLEVGIDDIAVNDHGVYALIGGGLYVYPFDGPTEQLWAGNGTSVLLHDGVPYWVGTDASGNQSIYRRLAGGGTSPVHYGGEGVDIHNLATDGESVFWVDSTTTDDTLQRKAISTPATDPPEAIDYTEELYLHPADRAVHATNLHLYYFIRETPFALRRITFDAAPLARDLAFQASEVVQVIQGLDANVPLVRNKPTYVRVYGTVVEGPPAHAVEAVLHGRLDDDSVLPESPLQPVNTNPFVPAGLDPERTTLGRSWLFKLPTSWSEGSHVWIEAEIDPREEYEDLDRSNNSSVSERHYLHDRPQVCTVFIPVRTSTPKTSTNDPNFDSMIALAQRIWPADRIDVHHSTELVENLTWCWWKGVVPYPCYKAYDLTDSGDRSDVLRSLGWRDVLTDDPDHCEAAGARIHYVGMVHPDANTSTTIGLGNLCRGEAWVKLPPHDPPDENAWDYPRQGFVLAHELGHNYQRYHVDCGGPATPKWYPYQDPNGNDCALSFLDLSNASTNFGFDTSTWHILDPRYTADLMTYSYPQWMSDYTYKYLYMAPDNYWATPCAWIGSICDTVDCVWEDARSASSEMITIEQAIADARVEVARADSIVVAGGRVGPDPLQGHLDLAWVLPGATASSGLREKWSGLAALRADLAPRSATLEYTLRLLDSTGGVLDERVVPVTFSDKGDTTGVFHLSFPAPASAADRILLMTDGVVVDELDPGPAAPIVTLSEPRGGETFTDSMTVRWRCEDADDEAILYTLQYTPDSGGSWYALASAFPGSPTSSTTELTIDLSGVPGSGRDTAAVRVIATDGYNTDFDTSAWFSVAKRDPEPYISSPAVGSSTPVTEPVRLIGGAWDAEDGSLTGGALEWRLDGALLGYGGHRLLPGLSPGEYSLQLIAQDSDGQQAQARARFAVAALSIPIRTTAPALDGLCDDEVYADGAMVRLEPYASGNQSQVTLLRTAEHLWACFTGLDRGASRASTVAVHVDANASGGSVAQPDDSIFRVTETGATTSLIGDGSGGFDTPGPGGFTGRVSTRPHSWTAEMRIDADTLGGWDHMVRLGLGHSDVDASRGSAGYHWPYGMYTTVPDSWAMTALGSLPVIDSISPTEVVAGSGDTYLAVFGSGFASDAEIRVSGTSIATTTFSSILLGGPVPASLLTAPTVHAVTVVNGGNDATESNARHLSVRYPKPVITALVPDSAVAEDPQLTVFIEVDGASPDGATVLWDGHEMARTPVAGGFNITVPASELAIERSVPITVSNPDPSASVSEPAWFEISSDTARIASADTTVCEETSSWTVRGQVSPTQSTSTNIQWHTEDGTAFAGLDYIASSGGGDLPPRTRTFQIPIEISTDAILEGHESFFLVLESSNTRVLTPRVQIVIVDEDGSGALPGDANGDCKYGIGDIAEQIPVVENPSYQPPGNPECDGTDPVDGADIECVLEMLFR